MAHKQGNCERVKKYNKTAKGVANRLHNIPSKEKKREYMDRYHEKHPDAQRIASRKWWWKVRRNDKKAMLMDNISKKLGMIVRDKKRVHSTMLRTHTSIPKRPVLEAHLEGQFAPDMSWANYGKISKSKQTWNVGHRIAIRMYDHDNTEDIKRCWSLPNMFPQWAINTKMQDHCHQMKI